MKVTTGLHVLPRSGMSGARPPLHLYVSRQTQGKLYFLTTIMYTAVLLVKLRKCDSGLVRKLHQTFAVLLARGNTTLSSCNNWFPSCLYKLVMTMIILAPTPWLLRPWKMHFFSLPFIYHLCIMHVATSAFVLPFYLSERSRNTLPFIHWKFRRVSLTALKKYILIFHWLAEAYKPNLNTIYKFISHLKENTLLLQMH
jgi:hypothetical protein